MIDLYANIKIRRLHLKMSQEELAKKVGYKDRTSIAKIESGKVDLAQSKIMLIAKALDMSPLELMGWDPWHLKKSYERSDASSENSDIDDGAEYNSSSNYYEIPICGTVTASMDGMVCEETGEYHAVAKTDVIGDYRDYFYLKAKGDSMNQARIYEDDMVLVRKQSDVDNSEIAVVIINDDEATIKRILKTDGLVILQPESNNPLHKTTIVSKEMNMFIVGKVIGVTFKI